VKFRWLAAVLLALTCWLPVAQAQTAPASTKTEESDKAPVLQYFLAVVFTLAVLVIVCMPSRKNR
jgi:hypothetical protein